MLRKYSVRKTLGVFLGLATFGCADIERDQGPLSATAVLAVQESGDADVQRVIFETDLGDRWESESARTGDRALLKINDDKIYEIAYSIKNNGSTLVIDLDFQGHISHHEFAPDQRQQIEDELGALFQYNQIVKVALAGGGPIADSPEGLSSVSSPALVHTKLSCALCAYQWLIVWSPCFGDFSLFNYCLKKHPFIIFE